MSKEEFIAGYCERAGVTWKWLSQYRKVVPCTCDFARCEGWGMVPLDADDDEEQP